jgi:hypothetical protein
LTHRCFHIGFVPNRTKGGIVKRAFVLAATGVVALATAGIAISRDDGAGPSEDRIYGGFRAEGAFVPSGLTPPPRDASIDAHAGADAKAYGELRVGRNDTGEFTVGGRITCVSAVGNKAVVGGLITASSTAGVVGEDFLWHAVDNGGPGAALRDRVSFVWQDADGSLNQGSFPGQLPRRWPFKCPAADAAAAADNLGTREAHGGDLVVLDVP